MYRILGFASAVVLACTTLAHAADGAQVIRVADAQDQAQLQAAATQHCNTALDENRFDYGSMDECIAADIAKMKRANNVDSSKSSSTAAPHGATMD